MFKIYKIIILLLFAFFSFSANAHVQHYEDLSRIEYHIYRNNIHIGTHIFSFKKSGDELEIKSKIKFEIEKFGIVLYKYYAEGIEIYKGNKLIKFNSTTNQNGKLKYANIEINNNNYIIDGSAYKGEVPLEFLIGTWWNHDIVEAPAQISAVSGRIIKQKVKFLAKEIVKFGENSYNTLHYNFSSTDKKIPKKKKLNTDIWYEEKTLNWIKASFNKKGKWEYRLVLMLTK